MNFVLGTLLNRLQNQNPGAYQFINNAISNNGNPNSIINELWSKASPEQRTLIINQAKNYGCPESYLKQLQNLR